MDAISNYDQAISLKTDFSRAYVARGVVKIKSGEQGGCEDFTKAEELGDKTVQYVIQLYCKNSVGSETDKKLK